MLRLRGTRATGIGCLVALLLAAAAALPAEPEAAEEGPLLARVAVLEARVRELEAELSQRLRTCPDPDAWRRRASWLQLRTGMDQFAVHGILGRPGRTVRYDGFERWEYPDLLGGRVNFDARGELLGWRPPPAAAGVSRRGSR